MKLVLGKDFPAAPPQGTYWSLGQCQGTHWCYLARRGKAGYEAKVLLIMGQCQARVHRKSMGGGGGGACNF